MEPFQFEIPSQFNEAYEQGKLLRYGALLKSSENGHIVGHLKELPSYSNSVSNIPVSDILQGEVVTNHNELISQVGSLKKVASNLGMVTTIGSIASVVTLGVCLTGFANINKRLDRLQIQTMKRFDEVLDKLNEMTDLQDTIIHAQIATALERVASAGFSSDITSRNKILLDSDQMLMMYRKYYWELIKRTSLVDNCSIDLEHVFELFGRYFAIASAELQCMFLLGDLEQWNFRYSRIKKELLEIVSILDFKEILRARLDYIRVFSQDSFQKNKHQIKNLKEFISENIKRLISSQIEISYIRERNIEPIHYLENVQSLEREEELGVILIKH